LAIHAGAVEKVLPHIDGDRYAIAWQLALTGLRRAEVAGLRWSDIDLDARTLPIPDHLAATLRAARAMQAADRVARGELALERPTDRKPAKTVGTTQD
jgi:integrase